MTLPQGWAETTLGDVTELIRGVTYNKDDARNGHAPGLVPLARATNIQGGRLDRDDLVFVPIECVASRQYLKAGDIVVATSSGSRTVVGKAAAARPEHSDMSFGAFCGTIRPIVSETSLWIARIFETKDYRGFVESVAIGTNINNLRSRDLEAYPVRLPPLAEQNRIVAKLDALTARLARARVEARNSIRLSARLKEGALAACFAQDGPIVSLGSLVSDIQSGKNLRCEERPPRRDELGVVKVSAVTWGRFDPMQSKTLPTDYTPPAKAKITPGDLLISRANTLELVGAVVMVEEEINNLYLSDKILRLVVSESEKKWIFHFLRSREGRRQIEQASTGNQVSMRNISQAALRAIELPLPAAATRQCRIAALEQTIARADRLEAEAKKALALIDRMEAAILARAFRGELVPQDPNDEPASVLLERIRARRAAEPTPGRGRKPRSAG